VAGRIVLKNLLKKTAVLAIAAILPSFAHAQFVLRVDDGDTNGVVIADNSTGDSNLELGFITWIGSMRSSSTFNVVAGISKPALASSSFLGEMRLFDVSIHGIRDGAIRLTLEDTRFGGAPGSWTQTGSIDGGLIGSGTTITAQNWVNTSNNVIALGPLRGDVGPIAQIGAVPVSSDKLAASPFSAGGTGSFGSTASSAFSTTGGAFSMFQQVTVAFDSIGGGAAFGSRHVAAIPEPETYAMMLAGLGLMGFVARRRMGANAA
jgi:PEP-CTERM motif-containing protein